MASGIRKGDLERVSKAKFIEQRNDAEMTTNFYFVRETPWGEKINVGIRLHDMDRYRMDVEDEREYFLNVAREAGRKLDHDTQQKHSERIAKGLPVGKVSSSGVGYSFTPPWEDEKEAKKPSRATGKTGKKKTVINDASVDKVREEKEMLTASETFDAIKDTLAQVNARAQPEYRDTPNECEIWFEAFDDTFNPVKVVSEEFYTFEKIVYSDRLDAIVVVMAPSDHSERHILTNVDDFEDAFPYLNRNLNRIVADLGSFKDLRELSAVTSKLTQGRSTFKKALSEASYAALGAATKAVADKKQNETEAFYSANPIYGLL